LPNYRQGFFREIFICQHGDEQDEIEMQLSRLIPQDFNEVRELLEHAIKLMDGGLLTNGADIMMLENILESLPSVFDNTKEAAVSKERKNAWPSHPHPRERVLEHGQFQVALMTLLLR
jgi:hypothetical protein